MKEIIQYIILVTLIVLVTISMYGWHQILQQEPVVSVQNNNIAIQMLSTKLTDLEARVNKLENPLVHPLPDTPIPKDY